MNFAPTFVRPMEWRPCVGYPDHEISECGDIRRTTNSDTVHQSGRLLRGFIDADGYICYQVKHGSDLTGKCRIRAHVAVALAFIGPAPNDGQKWEVAHNNGSRLCNSYWNLRWATRKENSDDRYTHDTSAAGINNPRAKITDDDVHFIRRRYREIKSERGRVAELDELFGMSRGQIIRIARGEAWTHVPWRDDDYGDVL